MKRDRYKRMVIFAEVIVLLLVYTVFYTYLWGTLYESAVFIPFAERGNWAIIIMYPLMLLVFGKIFGIFHVATARRVDMVFSYAFTALITNTITYFVLVALLRTHYPDPTPMILLFLLECAIAVIWVISVKALNNVLFPPHQLLLIHGNYSLKDLVLHVNERSERYVISEEINVFEDMAKLKERIADHDAVLISDLPAQLRNDVLKYCYDIDKRIYMLPKITDIIISSSDQIHLFDNVAFISKNYGLSQDQRIFKRMLDLFVSSVMIILTSWLMGIIAIAIKLDDGGPVFYRQDRLTINGKVFRILKFRSMHVDAEKYGPQLSTKKDPRITRVGRILRASHLDELPQLFNVISGNMSMVGPRPERPEIAAEYTRGVPEFNFRLKVQAGLTGYAQVYGRYNSTPYNKLRLDLTYIQNYSFWLDIKCIVMTVKILFQKENREGIEEGSKIAQNASQTTTYEKIINPEETAAQNTSRAAAYNEGRGSAEAAAQNASRTAAYNEARGSAEAAALNASRTAVYSEGRGSAEVAAQNSSRAAAYNEGRSPAEATTQDVSPSAAYSEIRGSAEAAVQNASRKGSYSEVRSTAESAAQNASRTAAYNKARNSAPY